MAGIVDDLRRIPMSQGLVATLARAADYAQAQSHPHVLLEHLLLALTEDEDAVQVLSASHVELSLLKADVSQYLGGLSERSQASPGTPMAVSPDLKRILEAAAAAASQGRRRDINGAIVLAAIVGDGRSAAAGMLRAQGLTFEEAIKALQRALAPAPARPVPPPEPDAEDILASARQRVQTRATPGLPPAPVVVPPEPQPAPAPPAVQAPPVAAAVWPP
jgi:neural Wiskott-Aldrich syndrome protein